MCRKQFHRLLKIEMNTDYTKLSDEEVLKLCAESFEKWVPIVRYGRPNEEQHEEQRRQHFAIRDEAYRRGFTNEEMHKLLSTPVKDL